MTIAGMFRKVDSIKLEQAIPSIIEDTKDELIRLNQIQLFLYGTDSEGNELAPYSALTEHFKRAKNQPYDRTTLKDTGAFYRAWDITTSDKIFTFNSLDGKTPELEAKYGTKIFGLTNENKTIYSFGAFFGGIKKHITDKTGLQFV